MNTDALEAYVNVAYTVLMAWNKIRRIQRTKRVRVDRAAKRASA